MTALLEAAILIFNSTGDPKEFSRLILSFDKIYKRANYREQGEYHHLWCQWLKDRP